MKNNKLYRKIEIKSNIRILKNKLIRVESKKELAIRIWNRVNSSLWLFLSVIWGFIIGFFSNIIIEAAKEEGLSKDTWSLIVEFVIIIMILWYYYLVNKNIKEESHIIKKFNTKITKIKRKIMYLEDKLEIL